MARPRTWRLWSSKSSNLCHHHAGEDNGDAGGLAPGERLLSDEQCSDERENGDGVGEDAGRRGSEMLDADVIEYVGQRAAEDAQDEEERPHLGREGEEGEFRAVHQQHNGQEIEETKEVLPGRDGHGLVSSDQFDEYRCEHHRRGHCPEEPCQSSGVGIDVAFAAPEGHDAQAYEGQYDAHKGERFNAFAIECRHAEGDEEWNGGHHDGGHAAADELHTAGLAEAIDEGLAEGEEEEPSDIAAPDGFQFSRQQEQGKGHRRSQEEAEGENDEDSDVLLGDEELLCHDETQSPDDGGEGEEDVYYALFHCVTDIKGLLDGAAKIRSFLRLGEKSFPMYTFLSLLALLTG